ncbi:MAG: YceI family protein [Bacteroidales bacterium]|nr:YceI family protein [Bacteroidales bacterium]
MKKVLTIIFLPTLLIFSEINAQTGENKKSVDLAKSKVLWVGSKPGGQHNGSVKLSSGFVTLNAEENISGGEFVIDMKSIVNYDLTTESMNKMLVDHLKSEDFFHVEKHPAAKFVIKEAAPLKNPQADKNGFKGTHLVSGDLTIKNITKPVSFHAAIKIQDGKLSATTEKFVLDRTEWSVNYQSKKIFAELKDKFIHDEMELSVVLETK